MKMLNQTTKSTSWQYRVCIAFCLLSLEQTALLGQDDDVNDDIFTLSPFEVSAVAGGEYQAKSSISAHIAELPISDIPINMNILTGDHLEDLGAFTVDDLGTVIPGASNASVPDGESRGLRLRGFLSPTYVNGFRVQPRFDGFWIERTEVAKGPAAVLYGSGAGGGVANHVFKRPNYNKRTKIHLGVGDTDYFRSYLDTTGAVSEGSDWAYRVMLHKRDVGSQVDFDDSESSSFYGALRGKFLDDKLIWDLSYGRYEYVSNLGLNGVPTGTYISGQPVDPQDRFPVIPDSDSSQFVVDKYGLGTSFNMWGPDRDFDYELDVFQTELVYNASDDLVFRAGFLDYENYLDHFRPASIVQDVAWDRAGVPPVRSVERNLPVQSSLRSTAEQATRYDMLWTPEFGETKHKIVASARFVRNSGRNDVWQIRRILTRGQQSDVEAGYLQIPQEFRDALSVSKEEFQDLVENPPASLGGRDVAAVQLRTDLNDLFVEKSLWRRDISLSDHITFLDNRAHLMVGIVHTKDPNTQFGGDYAHQVASIFDFTDNVSGFFNYSTDFNPVQFEGEFGVEEATTDGDGLDFGIRFSSRDARLTGSLAYFKTERSNIPRRFNVEDDPSTPDVNEARSFFVLSGKEEATGVEFTLDYNPNENLSLNFQASFGDPKVVSNNEEPRLEGQLIEDTVPNALVFGTRYNFTEGGLKGVAIGLNGWWRDEGLTESRYVRRFRHTTEHEIFNLFVSKDISIYNGNADLTLRLDIQNLLDTDDAVRSQSTYQQGRVIFGSATLEF